MDLLDAFERTYASTLADKGLDARIQLVKDALYRRSYIEAFDSKEKLEAYVIRWSPSRALAYASILESKDVLKQLFCKGDVEILCIGGGAGAELAALSRFHDSIRSITTIDIADWQPVVAPLAETLQLNARMICGDALDLVPQIALPFDLVTCCFTTNELVAESKQKFVALLRSLHRLKRGALFLVVESAGSYSEVLIGTKKFPVYYLLQFALQSPKQPAFELVQSTDSEWYRLPPDIEYPYELQNMRYLLRVYRRL